MIHQIMTFYVIRHRETMEIMPLFKRNRGYSHWNPGVDPSLHPRSLGVPRLLKSIKQANACIVQWNALPNCKERYFEDGPEIDIKPDGRKKEDLEVIEVKLQFQHKMTP